MLLLSEFFRVSDLSIRGCYPPRRLCISVVSTIRFLPVTVPTFPGRKHGKPMGSSEAVAPT